MNATIHILKEKNAAIITQNGRQAVVKANEAEKYISDLLAQGWERERPYNPVLEKELFILFKHDPLYF